MTMSTNRSVNLAFALLILPILAPVHAQSTAIRAVAQPAKLSRVTAGAYQEYNKSAFDAASGLQRILYFHATWCPTCKQANADLLKNLNMLPVNVVVFKTDYRKGSGWKAHGFNRGMQNPGRPKGGVANA